MPDADALRPHIGAERNGRAIAASPAGDADALRPHIGAERNARQVDRAIAALAQRQHGVVSRRQLAEIGISRRAIGHRLQCGRLHPLHRGVFAVGHRVVSREGRWMAAILAVGDGAVLSHHSAAALWGIRETARARVDVTYADPRRSRPSLHLHRSRLSADEVTVVRGIPVTTPARTLLDLAALLPPSRLERAVNEAEVLRLTDALALNQLIARDPRRPGVPALRRILDAALLGAVITRSEFEDRFLAFLAAAELPRPQVNARVVAADATFEVDCLWPTARLIVELDGFAAHGTRDAFERDRQRDRRLQSRGWRVLRLTWRQLHETPVAVAAELRALLAAEARASAKYPSLRP